MTRTVSAQVMHRVSESQLMTVKMTGEATLLVVLFVALVAALRESITLTASIPDARALAHDHLPALVTTHL